MLLLPLQLACSTAPPDTGHPLCRDLDGAASCSIEPWHPWIGECPVPFRATVTPAGALVSYQTRVEYEDEWDVEWTGRLTGDVFEWDGAKVLFDAVITHHRLLVTDGDGSCGVCDTTSIYHMEWLVYEGTDTDGDGFDRTEDCDDCDPEVSPAHLEVFGNGIDDDCDGLVD